MIIIAIDPGQAKSAFVILDTESATILAHEKTPNEELLTLLPKTIKDSGASVLAIEMIKSYGNAMGDSLLQTCVWIGRFIQKVEGINIKLELIPRKTIATHLCMRATANDKNVRAALIDMFGGKDVAVGRKKTPGPLYGVTTDQWSALGVAVVCDKIMKIEGVKIDSFLC